MFNTLNIDGIVCTIRRGYFLNINLLRILSEYKPSGYFLNINLLKLSEFRIGFTRLFYSIVTEGKKRVFEEIVFKIEKEYISRRFCVMKSD